MSTRATYEFVDQYGSHTVYKHHDGYPEGGLQWIYKALEFAWPLPRFEADDFGAAFIAANKPQKYGDSGGGVRLTDSRESHSDTEWHYIIKCIDGKINVRIEKLFDKTITEGFLDELLDRYAPDRGFITSPDDATR
jgi:hypothetical protein